MDANKYYLSIRRKQAERVLSRNIKSEKRHAKYKSERFVPIPIALIDNPEFRNGLMTKARFRTYLWLRRHVIRWHRPYDPCDVFSNYWMSGELSVSMKLDRIAKALKLPISTVSDHIRHLEQDGIIRVDKIIPSESPDGKMHLVFILGSCVNEREEWFIDDVYNDTDKN